MMRSSVVGFAFAVFAAGMVGSVAYRLWSENDLWSLAFLGPGALLLLLVIMWPLIQALRDAPESSPDDEPES